MRTKAQLEKMLAEANQECRRWREKYEFVCTRSAANELVARQQKELETVLTDLKDVEQELSAQTDLSSKRGRTIEALNCQLAVADERIEVLFKVLERLA